MVSPNEDDQPAPTLDEKEWEREQIQRIVARYPSRFSDELKAELDFVLFELKRESRPGIRNWRAYVATALRNRAVDFVEEVRKLEQREVPADEPESFQALPFEDAVANRGEIHRQVAEVRSVLGRELYCLLERYATERNQSRLAQEFGVHRNTIRRRLQAIFLKLRRCPIENVTTQERQELQQTAHASAQNPRMALRAKIILALIDGQSLRTVCRRFQTSRPAVCRWKKRFQKEGVEGLKSGHHGRRSDNVARARLARWLNRRQHTAKSRGLPSYRSIATVLGLSKSTVYRIMNDPKVRQP